MTDLRKRVEEERGLLKRIQLHVPGFAGYRRREDIRTADNMLRIQMANMLKDARISAQEAREAMAENSQYKDLDKLGRIINRFQDLEGKVRHAEGGYSGISADIRIEEDKMNDLYEYDASLLDDVVALGQEADTLKVVASDGDEVPESMTKLRSLLDGFADTFKKRMVVISRREVTE